MLSSRSTLSAFAALIALTASLAACSSSPVTPDDAASQPQPAASSAAPSSSADTQEEPAQIVPLALNADAVLGGDAGALTFDAGTAGELSVVQTGPMDVDAGVVPVVFRNSTDAAVSHVNIAGTAWDGAGGLLATGSSQGTTPAQLPPGGVALAYVYFGTPETPFPADVVYEFTFETSPADTSAYNSADLKVVEANHTGTTVIGSATNATGATVVGPYSVDVYCFDGGQLTSTARSYANESDDLAPDAPATFTVDLYDTPCATYLVGVTGYFA